MALRLRLLVAAALALGGFAATAPSYAVTGSPPVTVTDRVTVRSGEPTAVDVVANDTDPDGDELQACRLGPTPRALGPTSIEDGQLWVFPGRRAHGTYTVTYYACDASYLTPGTVRIKVRGQAPSLDVVPLDGLPGKVRITNTYKVRTFRCEWGPLGSERVEGRVTVRPRSSVVVRTRESEVEFECTSGNLAVGVGFADLSGRAGPVRVSW